MEQPIHLESVDTVLATARSVRRNLDFERVIEPQVLFDCIDLAAQSPTGAVDGESWRFVVVTEAARKQQLAALYTEALETLARNRDIELKPTHRALVSRLAEIPAMIFVCIAAPPPPDEVGRQVAFYGSVLPAAWSLMLALRARRIGTTWTTLLSAHQNEVGAILDMPENATSLVMLPTAYMKGARLKPAKRLSAREITFWDQWGSPPPHQ